MNALVMNYVAENISDLKPLFPQWKATRASERVLGINFVADLITIAIAAITILIGYNNNFRLRRKAALGAI